MGRNDEALEQLERAVELSEERWAPRAPRGDAIINGLHDETVPRESALRLAREARGPVRQIWLPHDHLTPGDTTMMRELADSTLSHFDFLRW